MKLFSSLLAAMALLSGGSAAQPLVQGPINDTQVVPGLEVLIARSEMLAPLTRTATGRAFLDATKSLPKQYRRYLWVNSAFTVAYTEATHATLDAKDKRGLQFRPVTGLAYYTGLNDRPLMNAIVLDLAVQGSDMQEPANIAGKKILLFNPTVLTEGRLLASLGADVTIVHNQPRLREMYSQPNDIGTIQGHDGGPNGTLRMIETPWPAEMNEEIGVDYDLIVISNWLSQGLSIKMTVGARWMSSGRPLRALDTEPEQFLDQIAGALKPGGRFISFAYGPIQPRRRGTYLPFSDVRFPFATDAIQQAGLEILALDADDTLAFLNGSIMTGYPGEIPTDGDIPPLTTAYTVLTKPAAD